MPHRPVHVLITRPAEDAAAVARVIAGAGGEAVIEPLLAIRFLPGPALDLGGVQALAFTSANGVRAFQARESARTLPAFAVGAATAAEARRAGFEKVCDAGGDVAELGRAIVLRLRPDRGVILHVAGTRFAGDLGGMLARAGFTYRREALYEALPARALSAETAQMVGKGEIAIATFFSPRTAATFANVVLDQGVAPGLRATTAVCLSAAVAEALGTLSWARVVVADRPTPETFGAALDRAIRAAMCGQERETLAEQDRDGPGKR